MRAEFKTITKEIKVKKYSDPITIWFFGDVHRDSKACDVDRWKHWLKTTEEKMDENTYFVGMGDYHDFASTSEKAKIKHNDLHDTTMAKLDNLAESDNRSFAKEIGFMRGKMLGLIEGNHSWIFQNGKSSTEDLAERMGTDTLGWLCHLSLKINFLSHSGSHPFHAVLCHGKAGGKTFGVTVNQVGDLKQIFPLANLYAMGHDHQRVAHPVNVLYPYHVSYDNVYVIKQLRQYLCRSGSFHKEYTDNSTSYGIGKLYRPSDLGALKVVINLIRSQKNGEDHCILDMHAEI